MHFMSIIARLLYAVGSFRPLAFPLSLLHPPSSSSFSPFLQSREGKLISPLHCMRGCLVDNSLHFDCIFTELPAFSDDSLCTVAMQCCCCWSPARKKIKFRGTKIDHHLKMYLTKIIIKSEWRTDGSNNKNRKKERKKEQTMQWVAAAFVITKAKRNAHETVQK